MFAGVPCYNLGRLHNLIKDEMPACTNGLIETWRQISWILVKQKQDPSFQFVPKVPQGTSDIAREES